MCTISEMQARLMQLASGLPEIVGNAMMENQTPIKELVVKQHTVDYLDSNGEPLKTHLRKYVFDFSPGMAQFRIDDGVNEEAASQLSLTVDVAAGEFEINSPATTTGGELKSYWLTKWNGSEIMGLTPDSKGATNAIITPVVTEAAWEILQV